MRQEESDIPRNADQEILRFVENYFQRWDNQSCMEVRETIVLQAWQKPKPGWWKLNSDGAISDRGAICGGVIRGEEGEWIRGFSVKCVDRVCELVEAWGVLYGLQICWDLGIKQLEVESDALQVVQRIEQLHHLHLRAEPWKSIGEMLSRDWTVCVQHVVREKNRCADRVTKLGLRSPEERIIWSSPPQEVVAILEEDRTAVGHPRVSTEKV